MPWFGEQQNDLEMGSLLPSCDAWIFDPFSHLLD